MPSCTRHWAKPSLPVVMMANGIGQKIAAFETRCDDARLWDRFEAAVWFSPRARGFRDPKNQKEGMRAAFAGKRKNTDACCQEKPANVKPSAV